MTKDELSARNYLVTGGSMGIGFACAKHLLECGANVVIAARGEETLDHAAGALRAAGYDHQLRAQAADVSRAPDVEKLVENTRDWFGDLHGVVHAAAVLEPIGAFLDVDPDEWWETLRINLFGTFLVARAAAKAMQTHSRGRMVFFSGGGATRPFPNFTAYACSKVAVVRLVETIAVELAPFGIEINAISPGIVATRMQDQTFAAAARAGEEYVAQAREEVKRSGGSAERAARATAFLLSDRAAGITGRLLSAPWDSWNSWPEHLEEIRGSDMFTLRRIVPADRGADWQ
jgi:NAD(P)-dependent dehydrogenase (short-subunit alcohol dehydrogenase family)